MSAKRFLEILEKSHLLEAHVLEELRKQVADTKLKITPEAIAKALVDRGQLTKFQATKLIGELPTPEAAPATKAKKPAADDDLLELAPLDDEAPVESPPPASATKRPGPAPQVDEEIIILEDAGGLTPVEEAGAGLLPVGSAVLTPAPEPLTLLGGGGLGDAAGLDPFAAAGGPAPVAPYQLRKKKQQWDTKLILGGVMTLLVMLLVGGVMLRSLLATPALEMFEAAEKAYRGQAYPDAKQKFEAFLKQYPNDEKYSSTARVMIGLVRLRVDLADPERGLTTAKEVLPVITAEKDADVGREEFPGLLPQIPEGFINRAKQAKETKSREDLLAKAREAMELVNDPENIPTSRRNAILPQLNRISEDITLVERTIVQEKELVLGIAAINKAQESGETVKAFELYDALLRRFPSLRDNASLREAVGNIVQRERSLVKVVEQPLTPVTSDVERTSQFRVVLASRTGSGEAGPRNPVAVAIGGGSVYALDAGNGGLLWSRFVGFANRSVPVRLSSQVDSDLLVVDGPRQELLRLKARSGDLVWRLPLGEPFSDPVVAGPRIYVATDGGKVWEIDADSGAANRHALLPQKLSIAPVAASDQPFIFQVGEHSNIYVLNTTTLACEDVILLGHKRGTIEVPPLILLGHLFVAENVRADAARIHCLKIRTSGEGPKLFPTQDPIVTSGRVIVPLSVYNRRLLVLTDRGEIRVADVDKAKSEKSVTDSGKLPPTLEEPALCYPLAEGTSLWVADRKLTKYLVQVTRKEITRDPAITSVGDTFIAPLQLFGNQLVHVRRVAGSTGTTVASIQVDNPRRVLWQTQLGVPAGRIAVNPTTNEIVAISSGAALYQITGDVLKSGYNDKPLMTAGGGVSLSFTTPIEFERDIVALFNPADNKQLLVYDPAAGAARLRVVPIQLGEGKAASPPVAFQGGLLTPSDNGTIILCKLTDGSHQVLPFQARLEPGEKVNWHRPAVFGAAGREFVIVDDRMQIYRIGVKDQPAPHLAELASARLEIELASGLAAAGDVLYGCVRSQGGDVLVAISGSDLKVLKEWDLKGGRVTWGPEAIGDRVFVVIDEKELRGFTKDQAECWSKPVIMHGQPAGRPLSTGEDLVFASVSGVVWRISGATGDELGKVELGEPLGAGPVAFRGRLLLCGNDGTLHVIAMPTAAASGG